MTQAQHDHRQTVPASRLVLFGFLGIIGFFLFTEHRAHVFGFLPYLLVLACPLMHLFMHGGHGHGGHGHGEQGRNDSEGGCCGGDHHHDTTPKAKENTTP